MLIDYVKKDIEYARQNHKKAVKILALEYAGGCFFSKHPVLLGQSYRSLGPVAVFIPQVNASSRNKWDHLHPSPGSLFHPKTNLPLPLTLLFDHTQITTPNIWKVKLTLNSDL